MRFLKSFKELWDCIAKEMEELAENKTLLFDNVPWDVLAIYKLQPLARPPFLILAMQLNKPERAEQIYI